MNMNGAVAKSNTHMGEMPTQPTSGSGVPAVSNVTSHPLNASTMQHAIALQQFQFQQSLVSQQLLHAVNIKAAAEQAAARAAEISSRLLKGEKTDTKKEKAEEPSPKREKTESRSQARSPSLSQSSRSKSVSPIRYRHNRSERERYSPREHGRYRSHRYSSYYVCGRDDYRSSYRRYADRSHGRGYSYYRGRSNGMRRTRRSPSRSWSPRYRHGESPSPRSHRIRSPSPRTNHRKSARDLDRRSLSRSPIGISSLSPSPRHPKVRSPKRSTDRRSLSFSRSSQGRSTTSILKKENKGGLDGSSSENNNGPAAAFTQRGKEAISSREQLRSDHSSSSARSESSSADHSGEKNIGEPTIQKTVIGKCASAGRGRAGFSSSSDGETTPRASETSGGESELMHIRDSRFSRRDEDGDNRDNLGRIKNVQKLSDSTVRRLEQDCLKLSSIDNHSLSSEDATGHRGPEHNSDDGKDNTDANDPVDKEKLLSWSTTANNFKSKNSYEKELPQSSNEGSPYSLDTEIDIRTEAKDHWNRLEDVITVEDAVNDSVCTIKHGPSNQEVNTFEGPHNGSKRSRHSSSNEDEFKNQQGCDIEATVMLPDGFTWEGNGHNSGSPTSPQSMKKRSKQRSKSKERRSKHSRRHRKRHRRDESEEDFDSKKESRSERKLKKQRRKAHRRHEKSRKERKRRKTRHRASSSSVYSSSSDGEYTEFAPSKRSTGHKKKRGQGTPSAISG